MIAENLRAVGMRSNTTKILEVILLTLREARTNHVGQPPSAVQRSTAPLCGIGNLLSSLLDWAGESARPYATIQLLRDCLYRVTGFEAGA